MKITGRELRVELDDSLKDRIRLHREAFIQNAKTGPLFSRYLSKETNSSLKDPDPANTENTKSVTLNDSYALYHIVSKIRPRVIVEIGTFIGTSASIMAMAMRDLGIDGKIYTCDKNNIYGGGEHDGMIKYHNMKSEKFLKLLLKMGVRADMFFVDASLSEGDEKIIRLIKNGRIVYANHDKMLPKGVRNMDRINRVIPNCEVSIPSGSEWIYIMEEK